MTYLNKGQFYPITLREIDNKGMQQPITKVRVRNEELLSELSILLAMKKQIWINVCMFTIIILFFSFPECSDGGVWRGEVQR